MTRAVTLLLVTALIGLPLVIAQTDATLALAGAAGLFAVVGVLISNSSLLIAGVSVSLIEALAAFRQGGSLLLALSLGMVIYLLLDISAFFTTFHGVSPDTSVLRTKATYWGWVSVLLGFTGLVTALMAATLAYTLVNPLLAQVLAVLAAATAVGAIFGVLRGWQKKRV